MDKAKEVINKKWKKIKKRTKEISLLRYIKTNILFITYVLINLFASWILRIVTMENYFSFPAMVGDLAFILVIGAFAYLVKPKNQIKILMPLTIVMTLICVINAVYYENYVSFASFSLLSTASFLGDMDGGVVTSLIHLKDIILIYPPIVLLVVHLLLKKKDYYKKVELIERGKKRFLKTAVWAVIAIFVTFMLMQPSD